MKNFKNYDFGAFFGGQEKKAFISELICELGMLAMDSGNIQGLSLVDTFLGILNFAWV